MRLPQSGTYLQRTCPFYLTTSLPWDIILTVVRAVEQYLVKEAGLTERHESYLEQCEDQDNWARVASDSIYNFVQLYRCGEIDTETCARCCHYVSELE